MNFQEILNKQDQIEAVAQRAASFIRSHFEDQDIETETKENKNSLVSFVDREAEKLLVEGLSGLFPDFGFITEEDTVDQDDTKPYYWIVDPLDGTTNFLHGLPQFSVSLALSDRQDRIRLGCVLDVMREDIYFGADGHGATKNGEKLLMQEVPLAQALVSTGFPYYTFENKDTYITYLSRLMELTRGIRRCGSAGLDLVHTAEGIYSLFFEYDLKLWDIAAGAIIIKEAGGIVTDFDQNEEGWKKSGHIVAGNALCHREFFDQVAG